ncbi:MAG: phosphotransferase [Verrucomicrobiales bacterium]|nr:phosphotransferase [Verrucomicrobiales bacterium]
MSANETPSDDRILELTRAHFSPAADGAEVALSPLPGGGSDRQYWRLKTAHPDRPDAPPQTAIYMHYTDARPDNLCFITSSSILGRAGVSIPEIYAHDDASMSIWLEDLGNFHLWDYRHEPWEIREPLYRSTLREIAKIHALSEDSLSDTDRATLQPGFDEKLYAWEQNYFFDQFLARFSLLPAKQVTSMRDSPELNAVRARLSSQPRALVHRDFQSQNVLIRDGHAVIIDFQGLRPGRPEYDIASLLFDPYITLSPAERDSLITYYLELVPISKSTFEQNFADCAIQRLMQALGAYGYLSTQLNKTQFLRYVPRASEVVRELVSRGLAPEPLGNALAPDSIELS